MRDGAVAHYSLSCWILHRSNDGDESRSRTIGMSNVNERNPEVQLAAVRFKIETPRQNLRGFRTAAETRDVESLHLTSVDSRVDFRECRSTSQCDLANDRTLKLDRSPGEYAHKFRSMPAATKLWRLQMFGSPATMLISNLIELMRDKGKNHVSNNLTL
jgi:hypothetical protein